VGQSRSSTVYRCFSICTVNASSWSSGGIVGYNYVNSTVSNCYSSSQVNGTNAAAGLVGNNTNSTVRNSYSTGHPSASSYLGGLVGLNQNSTTVNSFWDIESSGLTTSLGGTGKTTAQMKDLATFTSLATTGLTAPWDFMGNPNNDTGTEDIWALSSECNNGYPNLNHESQPLSLDAPEVSISFDTAQSVSVITWNAITNAVSYKIYSTADPYAVFPEDWTLVDQVPAGEGCTLTVPAEGVRLFYCVTASTNPVTR
jgi:hypothetical protein